MTDNSLPDAAHAPEVPAVLETAPPADDVTSTASPEPAALDAEAPANGETEADPPPAPDETAPAARKPKADRIQEVIAERNYWRDQAMKAQPAKAEPAPPAPEPEEAPTLEQHGFDTEKWASAYTQWSDKRVDQKVERALKRTEAGKEAQTIQQTFAEREAQFVEANPDYVEAVADPGLQRYVTPTISEAVVLSENGPALSYYLATHRDELAAISRLRPTQQAVALGKIEAKLPAKSAKPAAATPPKKTVQQTRAPAPPKPVGGNAPSKRPEDMSIDEYMQHRQQWSQRR